MVRIKRGAKPTGEITIASMSDVAFLLIIFFLVTSIFLLKDGLHLSLPDTTKPATVVGDLRRQAKTGANPSLPASFAR